MTPNATRFDEFIHYGQAKHAEEFQRLHENTKRIAYHASILSKSLFNELLITTSIFRKKTNDSGIHESFRAIDFAPLQSIANTYRLIEIINSIFIYDPERPNLLVGEPPYHGTGLHIHFQSHPNTTVLSHAQSIAFLSKASHDKSNFHPIKLGEINV